VAEISRRGILQGGVALAAAGVASLAASRPAWAWSSSGSVAGGDTTTDPSTVWDDPADAVVSSLLASGQIAALNAALTTWVLNADPVPAATPASAAAFLAANRQLPSWADTDKLALAATFNARQGDIIAVLYGMGSGMMSCLIPHEARAVYYSRGGANMRDRVAKTAKLGYDVGSLDAYLPGGQMIVTALKTRMTHAAVRTLLPQSPYWTPTADEPKPISQRDLLITWHSLASFVMQHLHTWNIPVSDDESAAYLHLWQVTAHMLGIQDQFIPATWSDAFAQKAQLLDPILSPTPEGLKLAKILVNLGSSIDGGFASTPMLEAMTRFVLGNTYANWLGMPVQPVLDLSIAMGWPMFVAVREGLLPVPGVADIYWTLDEFVRQGALYYLSNGQGIDITIPDANRTSF
jgi:hypothetical protein